MTILVCRVRYSFGGRWSATEGRRNRMWRHHQRRWRHAARVLSERCRAVVRCRLYKVTQETTQRSVRLMRVRIPVIFKTRSSATAEIARVGGHYAVQGHSRSPISVPIESPDATSYQWIILTYILFHTISKLLLIICRIFASDRGGPLF